MKKALILCLITVILVFSIIKFLPQGFRGGDSFQNNTINAINIHFGSAMNYIEISKLYKCNKKIYIQVFHDLDADQIHLATFEKKNDKFAYLYGYDFVAKEINDNSGLIAYEVYNKCDVIYGIIPGDKNTVIVNQSILAENFSFKFNEKNFKCWYASVNGGYDAVENVSYG